MAINIFLLLFALFFFQGISNPAREKISLDFEWKFYLGDYPDYRPADKDFDDSMWR